MSITQVMMKALTSPFNPVPHLYVYLVRYEKCNESRFEMLETPEYNLCDGCDKRHWISWRSKDGGPITKSCGWDEIFESSSVNHFRDYEEMYPKPVKFEFDLESNSLTCKDDLTWNKLPPGTYYMTRVRDGAARLMWESALVRSLKIGAESVVTLRNVGVSIS